MKRYVIAAISLLSFFVLAAGSLPASAASSRSSGCVWQEGRKYLPGTTNDFGGSSTTEFGPLLKTVYPEAGFTTLKEFNNFNSGIMRNPC